MLTEHKLKDYQIAGVEFMANVHGGILLGDEQGCGKTAQVVTLAHRQSLWPLLVVCPATLKGNWEKELRMWAGADSMAISGEVPVTLPSDLPKAVIVNYDILYEQQHVLAEVQWGCIAFDEAHYLSSRTAKRTKAARYLARRNTKVIAMTGTPIINKPADFWSILNIIRPAEFPSFQQYAARFCDPQRRPWGWDYGGASNLPALRELIQPFTLRRLKKDVLDLPEKNTTIVKIELDPEDQRELDRAEGDFLGWLQDNSRYGSVTSARKAEALTKLGVTLQLTARLKARKIVQWAKKFFADNPEKKLVLFAHHTAMVDVLSRRILDEGVVVIDGSVPSKKRQAIVESFQKDPKTRLMVANIKAAGVGITLTAASDVAFAQLWWTPSAIQQASDRIHRISQTEVCNVHFLLVENSVEEKLVRAIETKQQTADAVMDGKKTKSVSILDLLLQKPPKGMLNNARTKTKERHH